MGDAESPLPATAHEAWRAYCDMLATKSAHFEFLAQITREAEAGQPRTLARSARLAALLEAHTHAVSAFRAAMVELADQDPAARLALLARLTRDNASHGSDDTRPH